MFDGTKPGYEKGKKDATADKPRDPTPPLVQSVLDDRFRREYPRAYERGYDDTKQSQQQGKKS